ncbi:MAG: spermidine synthase, partial [Terriglobia bacterium]
VYCFHEDIQGGLTSVVQSGPSRLLLSNGKFQGNNTGEVGEQVRFALTPILLTRNFNRALVIGLGTGNTLRVVSLFPFQQIDAVELAPSMVDAARRWFPEINGLVFDRDPRVKLSITDGRNYLLLSQQRYDLITLEITSIWISGEADLYNREFYNLARQHLTSTGVLQQWVQIHHMRLQDLLVILNTAAQVFPHVAFFMGHEQGLLIASSSPLQCDAHAIESFEAEPAIRRDLDFIHVPSMMSLLGELMLYGPSMRQALSDLPRISSLPADFASTDFFPYLEYETPHGNALPYNTVPVNTHFLESLRPDLPPPGLELVNFKSASDRDLTIGYIDEREGNLREALGYFERVEGPEQQRARLEIEKIQSVAN